MKQSIKTHVLKQYAEKAKGYIIYSGKSYLTGKHEIAGILTLKSSNEKTGNIAQITYFPTSPDSDKTYSENKKAVCGNCPLLGSVCYVSPMGTSSIKRAYEADNYQPVTLDQLPAILAGYIVRNGADGDPLSIPPQYINAIHSSAGIHLSYSHQWQNNPEQAGFHMASVETPELAQQAQAEGWKTYRVRPTENDPIMDNEILCPNEKDPSIQCIDCQLCTGNKVNVVVTAHGSPNKHKQFSIHFKK